jgi:hypothetical protein
MEIAPKETSQKEAGEEHWCGRLFLIFKHLVGGFKT